MNQTSQDVLPTPIRNHLRGKSIAIIGSDIRHEHAAKIKRAFELMDVLWIPTRSTDPSPRRYQQLICRQQVDLVVALHGLLLHQHIHDLRELCRQHRVPLVVCWRSPHLSSLAAAILNQLFRPEMSRGVHAA